jgi:hypothetical protein
MEQWEARKMLERLVFIHIKNKPDAAASVARSAALVSYGSTFEYICVGVWG